MIYDPADGKTVQNVWTKKEQEREIYKDQAKVDQRIEFSNGKPNYKHLPSDVIDEYQNQSNALYKEFARFEPDKLKALNEYTDSAYIGINEYLATKKGNLKQYAQYVNSIEGAMEQFHLKNDIIVYRGTQATFYEGIKVGDTFDSKIFYSTSYSEDVAKDFSNVKKEPLLIEIHAPKNSKCIFIGQNSTSFDEGEFIFSHKSRYKVIDQQDGKMVLEVINEKD
ncbi:ADP-ribosyltransferase [Levyella massiliensis]|uniref:ADP-ribosyltransferase n=1 Tax=Levyella massiliensis TaxID=938289 RepID=UPI0024ADD5D9|nr:ADP-ribosyltransferase [Levyella massiliensis]